MALLWPDANDDRARRNLSQLLYVMKSDVGADLVEGTNILRLAADVSADVIDFDAAIAARRDADAVALYSGPFLDGFHLPESAEFSFWADGERDVRTAQARAAAVRAARGSTGTEAVAAWRQALALDPLSVPVVLGLMDALALAGDRAAAIRVADQHATLMKAELDSEPDASVVRRASELRRLPAARSAEIAAPIVPTTSALRDPSAGASPAVRDTAETADAAATGEQPSASWSRWRRYRRELVAVALLVGGGLATLAFVRRAPARLRRDEFVLMSEFVNNTGDSLLTRTIGTAVTAALQQSAQVVLLPRARVSAALRRMELSDTAERLPLDLAREVAQREGVRLVLAGEVIGVGTSRQVISRIVEATTGRVIVTRTFTAASDDELLAAIDRLAGRMRRDLGEAAAAVDSARPLPDVTTPSLAALHAYAAGIDADRRTERAAAANYYLRAIELDSNFASAQAKVGELYALNNDIPRSAAAFRRALSLLDRLPLDEQLRIKLSAAWARGDYSATVDLSRTYLTLRPRDTGALTRLAFSLFTVGQDVEARAIYARADSLAPLSAGALVNVGTSWLQTARQSRARAAFDSALAYYHRAFVLSPALEYDSFYNQQYGAILLGVGEPDSARATFERMGQRGSDDHARALRSLAFLAAWEGRWSDAAHGFTASAELSYSERQWTSAIRNDALAADLHLTLGNPADARAPLVRAQAVALREPLEARAIAFIALAQAKRGDVDDARRLLARMQAMARKESLADQSVLLEVEGAIALHDQHVDEANEKLAGAFLRDSLNVQIGMWYARALEAAGRNLDALHMLDRAMAPLEFGMEGQFDVQLADADRARLLERLDRRNDAVAALRRLVARYSASGDPLEPQILREARARVGADR